jgi:type I restriction enzyme S subunit
MKEDWIECSLDEVCEVLDNLRKPINSNERNERIKGKDKSELYPYYGATGQVGYIDDYLTDGEYVLLGEDAAPFLDFTKDVAYKITGKTWVNNHAHILKSHFNDDFLLHFLNQFQYRDYVTGTTRLKLTQGALKRMPFKLAPLPIQRAIVSKIEALFSDLDNGIANFKKAQEQLKIYRQAVLKKAFEGELTKEWREKQSNLPTAEELLKQIKEERQNHYNQQIEDWKKALKEWEKKGSVEKKPLKPKKLTELSKLKDEAIAELPELPSKWVYDYLAYAGELGRGKSKHRPRNDKKLFGGEYPFFQTGDVKAQKVLKHFTQTYNEVGLKQSKLWKKGTLCITIAANIAETGFLGIDACFPDSIVGYNPYEKIVDARYIDYFFQSAKNKISAFAPATAQKNINLTTLENLVIPFCSLQEQTQIVQEIESRLSVCDKMEQSINDSIEKAEALRQSILKKAFEGKLLSEAEIAQCKQAADYEPASELLKKIQAEKLAKEQEKKKKPTVKKKSKK